MASIQQEALTALSLSPTVTVMIIESSYCGYRIVVYAERVEGKTLCEACCTAPISVT